MLAHLLFCRGQGVFRSFIWYPGVLITPQSKGLLSEDALRRCNLISCSPDNLSSSTLRPLSSVFYSYFGAPCWLFDILYSLLVRLSPSVIRPQPSVFRLDSRFTSHRLRNNPPNSSNALPLITIDTNHYHNWQSQLTITTDNHNWQS